jgi:hypothetical protein
VLTTALFSTAAGIPAFVPDGSEYDGRRISRQTASFDRLTPIHADNVLGFLKG